MRSGCAMEPDTIAGDIHVLNAIARARPEQPMERAGSPVS
jgi:hypothetical protein